MGDSSCVFIFGCCLPNYYLGKQGFPFSIVVRKIFRQKWEIHLVFSFLGVVLKDYLGKSGDTK